MAKALNIIFITLSSIDDINQRGIYSDLIRCFLSYGHNVEVFSPLERSRSEAPLIREFDKCKIIRFRSFNIQKTNFIEKGLSTLFIDFLLKRALKNYLALDKYDLAIYSTPPVTLSRSIKFLKNKFGTTNYLLLKDIFPQCLVDLGVISNKSIIYKYLKNKERKLYEFSDSIGCMSPANVEYVLDHNIEVDSSKVEVCPNSITPIDIVKCDKDRLRGMYNIPEHALVFIYGGNFGKPQAIDFIIDLLEINKLNSDVFFILVGRGTEFYKIESWFNANNPSNSLLLSYLPKAEYDEFLQVGDVGMIFLDNSYTIPNFPSRMLAYLENSLPLILATDLVSDIGHIAEANGFGLWSRTGDIQGFENNMKKFLSMDSVTRENMGQRGNEFLKKEYTSEHSYDIIMNSLKKYQ